MWTEINSNTQIKRWCGWRSYSF